VQDVADRLTSRVQITSDGLPVFTRAIEQVFGWNGCDYGRVVKVFGGTNEKDGSRRYSPAVIMRADKEVVMGRPDDSHISTSFVERQNLTMRMQLRPFCAPHECVFQEDRVSHVYAISLYYMYYNYCRTHTTLSKKFDVPTTPATAAGLAERVWTTSDLLYLLQGN
jgi:hypothetical protein